jgi:hypothetical protein
LLTVALVFVAAVWTLGLAGMSVAEGLLGWDVRFAYLPAADAVLDGRSVPRARRPDPARPEGYVYPPAPVPRPPADAAPDAVVSVLVAACLIALVV